MNDKLEIYLWVRRNIESCIREVQLLKTLNLINRFEILYPTELDDNLKSNLREQYNNRMDHLKKNTPYQTECNKKPFSLTFNK